MALVALSKTILRYVPLALGLGGYVFTEERVRVFLMCIRQAVIMVLGGLEDLLEIERSRVPKRKRG